MCSENMALPSWYNAFRRTTIKILSESLILYTKYRKKETFNSLQEYFAEVGGPTLLEEQKKIYINFIMIHPIWIT